jgi:hypothetical protein
MLTHNRVRLCISDFFIVDERHAKDDLVFTGLPDRSHGAGRRKGAVARQQTISQDTGHL